MRNAGNDLPKDIGVRKGISRVLPCVPWSVNYPKYVLPKESDHCMTKIDRSVFSFNHPVVESIMKYPVIVVL